MSYGFKIMVKGDYAAFNRPEMKVERVSYDVPTPGALEGLIKSVYWKPAIRYVIDKIIVYGKDRLEIQFKYADEIQEMTEVAQNIREIEEKEGRFKCGA